MLKTDTGAALRLVAWIVGLFILYTILRIIENHEAAVAQTTHLITPRIWSTICARFILGAYVSPIYIRNWTFHLNWAILAMVFLPFTLLSLYLPMAITFSWTMPFQIGIHLAPYFEFFPMIAGFGLISGILGDRTGHSAHP